MKKLEVLSKVMPIIYEELPVFKMTFFQKYAARRLLKKFNKRSYCETCYLCLHLSKMWIGGRGLKKKIGDSLIGADGIIYLTLDRYLMARAPDGFNRDAWEYLMGYLVLGDLQAMQYLRIVWLEKLLKEG